MTDGIKVTIDDEVARALLGSLAQGCVDLARPMDAIGLAFAERARQTFHDETDPWGAPWTPLAPATIKARRDAGKGGVSILRDTGRLIQSLTHAPDEQGVDIRVGATDRPAPVHQFGSLSRRIPARPMLPVRSPTGSGDLPPDFLDTLIEITMRHLEEAMK